MNNDLLLRYLREIGKTLEIKNYFLLTEEHLQLNIGRRLIELSGLVDPKTIEQKESIKQYKLNLLIIVKTFIEKSKENNLNEQKEAFETIKNIIQKDVIQEKDTTKDDFTEILNEMNDILRDLEKIGCKMNKSRDKIEYQRDKLED